MQQKLFALFKIAIGALLIGKMLNWFIIPNEVLNQSLNTMMFVLIGISFLVMGFVWDNKVQQAISMTCGLMLITIQFFAQTRMISILGILCILTPMLMARLYKNKGDHANPPASH